MSDELDERAIDAERGEVDDTDVTDDEYVEVREPRERGRRVVVVLVSLLVVLALVGGAGAYWVQRQIDPPGAPGASVVVEIPPGTSTSSIGDILERNGVITSALVWKTLYVRLRGVGPFDAGSYKLRRDSSMSDVVDILEAGPLPPPFLQVTVPEGLTVREILARLADSEKGVARFSHDRLRALVEGGKVRSKYQPAGQSSMEGLLFPETYHVEDEDDELAVLQRLVGRLDRTLDDLDVTARARRLGLTPYEVIIVASLIEEETKVEAERAKVARVIYNRLAQGIPLGIDATSRYEAELAGRDRSDIDFDSSSPYNTRRQAGLPPTPIAAPGRASLEAALAPADGPWIYYVLIDAKGHHLFTDSAQEFERAKAECKRQGLGCG
jgi:UPF0755 protein